MESMRTTIAYYDEEYIWTVDDIFGGLYRVEISNMIVFCVISAMEMYKYGVFEVASVIAWEGYIIVIPKQIKQRWVFYDKITKEISHQKVVDIYGHTPEVCVINHFVYIPPLYRGEPFTIFDLRQMQICTVINDFYKGDVNYEIWRNFNKDGACCVPLRGTRCVYAFSGLNYKEVQVKIVEVIGDACCAKEGYWVLPQSGNYIYETDNNGFVTEKVKLTIDKRALCADYFVRIVSTDMFIFLLPYKNDELYVYEKGKCELFRIARECLEPTNSVIYDIDEIPYWGYYTNDKEICFLPRRTKWISFDLKTYKISQKDIHLPGEIDYLLVKKWILHLKNHDLYVGETRGSLSMFLDYIGISDSVTDISDCPDDTIGKRIYKYILKWQKYHSIK